MEKFRKHVVAFAILLTIGLTGMALAPLVMAQQRQTGGLPAPLAGGAPPAGVPFLPSELGGAKLVVEIAFGANVADLTQSSWRWVDVSADVHFDPGVNSVVGKQSESVTASPAEVSFQLDNTSGSYTQYDYRAKYWPNVKEGTPIRVRVIISGQSYTRFQGRAIGFQPGWDSTGVHAIVTVTASGISRTLDLSGAPPLPSAMYTAITTASPAPAVYWPIEQGKYTTVYSSPISGVAPMSVTGNVNASQIDGPRGSDRLAEFSGGGSLTGTVPSSRISGATSWRVDFAAKFDPYAGGDFTAALGVNMDSGGSVAYWEIDATSKANGGIYVQQIASGGGASAVTSNFLIDDKAWHLISLQVTKSGANINYALYVDDVSVLTGTDTSATWGLPVSIVLNPSSGLTNEVPSMGQVVLWGNTQPDLYPAFLGHTGETCTARMTRLCSENGVNFTSLNNYSSSVTMGPQAIEPLITQLRECESTDAGVLYDGLTDGFSFSSISSRYDQTSVLTLNAVTSGDVLPDFTPIADDFARANIVTVQNRYGDTVTVQDTTSPLSVSNVGGYNTSPIAAVNYQTDATITGRAQWMIHVGTYATYRYPNIQINMRKIPDRAALMASLVPGMSVTIVPPYNATFPVETFDLVVEGWSEFLTNLNWELSLYCTKQDIYNVWKIGDPQFGRLGTQGHTLAGDAHPGDTTIGLSTPSGGALWTTSAGDFPLSILVDGIKLTLTTISGSSSPQTGTLDTVNTPIPRTIQSGQAVTMWKNGVLSL